MLLKQETSNAPLFYIQFHFYGALVNSYVA